MSLIEPAWHAEAEARYRAGETLREIAEALSRSTGRICDVLHARGVPMRKRGGGGTPEQKREAGRKGGTATLAGHGREHFARIGRKGGLVGDWERGGR
jgi:hypothetical protein